LLKKNKTRKIEGVGTTPETGGRGGLQERAI